MHSTKDQTSKRTGAIGSLGPTRGRCGYAWELLWVVWESSSGAAGTHALEGRISTDALDTLETGVRFQMYHAIALVGTGAAAKVWRSRAVTVAGILMSAGTVVFCGSLYLLALLDIGVFGAVAPIGGLSLMAGWAALAIGAGIEFIQRTNTRR